MVVEAADHNVVLVVDDDPNIRRMIVAALKRDGYSFLEAPNGRDALDIMRSDHPDVVVLDLMMPRVDGFDVLRALRAHPDAREMPVMVLTADSRSDHHRRCYELGADDVMTKPFLPDALVRGLSRMLDMSIEDRTVHRADAAEAARDSAFS